MCWNRLDGHFTEVLNSYHRFDAAIWSSSPSYKWSPEKMQTVPVLPQSSDATERVQEFTPFCTAASSNGATPSAISEHHPLPLSHVGRKADDIQTTHTILAQSHSHELCRITQTAVAPQSCFDTCVLWLTRVRAQP